MRLILSRKGFDSSAGGCPSPVLPDGSLCVLPIPDVQSKIRYRDVAFGGRKLGKIASDLTAGKVRAGHGAHLDPDLVHDALPREPGWRPLLGQMGAAQGHLRNQGVGEGDLFLFFGLFRRAELHQRRWRFVPGSRPFHGIWGWLRAGTVMPVDRLDDGTLPWARYHPHLQYAGPDPANTLYLASGDWKLPGGVSEFPGSGVFHRLQENLILTDPEARLPSRWRLPAAFYPAKGKPALSYHQSAGRWRLASPWCYLDCAARGQEFVLDLNRYPALHDWLGELLGAASDNVYSTHTDHH